MKKPIKRKKRAYKKRTEPKVNRPILESTLQSAETLESILKAIKINLKLLMKE